MLGNQNRLDHVRVASPCSVSWDSMSGGERVRSCEQCRLRVYNISELTRREAEALIAQTEGRICARFYRRADGTILTKDCPVGLSALRRRLAGAVGLAFTAFLSLTAGAFGQTLTRASKESGDSTSVVTRTLFVSNPQEGRATCRGYITDPNEAVIPDAAITLVNEKTKYKRVIKSGEEGEFSLGLLEPGLYTLRIESPGFAPFVREHLRLHSNEELRLDVTLDVAVMGVIVCEEPPSTGITIDGVRVKIN
jgi:hypothetical protein